MSASSGAGIVHLKAGRGEFGFRTVFHYVSAFLITSTLALLALGFGVVTDATPSLLVRFIALTYAVFAVWQIVLAAMSGISRGLLKIFQWVFFVIIAVCAWLGA